MSEKYNTLVIGNSHTRRISFLNEDKSVIFGGIPGANLFSDDKLHNLVNLARSYYKKRFNWICFHLGGNEAETISNTLVHLRSYNLDKIKHTMSQNLHWNGETIDPLNILPLYQNSLKNILDKFIHDFCAKIFIIKKEINYDNLLLVLPGPRYKMGGPIDIYFNLAAYYFSNILKKNAKFYFPRESIKILDPFSREWGEGMSNERLISTIHNKKEVEDFFNGCSTNGIIHYSTFKYKQILMSIKKITGIKLTQLTKYMEPSTGTSVLTNSYNAPYSTALLCEKPIKQNEVKTNITINPTAFTLLLDDMICFPPLKIPVVTAEEKHHNFNTSLIGIKQNLVLFKGNTNKLKHKSNTGYQTKITKESASKKEGHHTKFTVKSKSETTNSYKHRYPIMSTKDVKMNPPPNKSDISTRCNNSTDKLINPSKIISNSLKKRNPKSNIHPIALNFEVRGKEKYLPLHDLNFSDINMNPSTFSDFDDKGQCTPPDDLNSSVNNKSQTSTNQVNEQIFSITRESDTNKTFTHNTPNTHLKWNKTNYTQTQLNTKFINLSKKLTRYKLHKIYLKRCIENKIIPKGMYTFFPITIGFEDKDLVRKIKTSDVSNAVETANILLDWYDIRLDELRHEFFCLKKYLERNICNNSFKKIWFDVRNTDYYLKRKILKTHNSKFIRDTKYKMFLIEKYNICEETFSKNINPVINNTSVSTGFIDMNKPFDKNNSSSKALSEDLESLGLENVENNFNVSPNLQKNQVLVLDNSNIAISQPFIKTKNKKKCKNTRKNGNLDKYHPINLCHDKIDDDLKNICALGPSFVPSNPNINYPNLFCSFKKWVCNLKKAAWFFLHPPVQRKEVSVRDAILKEIETKFIRSDWLPPDSFKVNALEAFIEKVKNEIFDPKNLRKCYPNLSAKNLKAIRSFKEDDKHVLRIQDKGNKFTYNTSINYSSKIKNVISNPDKFTILQEDPTPNFIERINTWAESYLRRGELTQKLVDWLIPNKAAPGAIYGLDKTHKNPIGMRTITSGCGTAIENLSAWVTYFLKPIAMNLPHCIRDTCAFLKLIKTLNSKGPLPEDIHLVAIDVKDMFASIKTEKGLNAIRPFLNQRETLFPSTKCILDGLKICLQSNCSKFDDLYAIQEEGAATGPKYVCDYADIAMLEHDEKINSFDPNSLLLYTRYRDDGFMVWKGDLASLDILLLFLNSIDNSIQFTLKSSKTELEYLDMLVYVKNNTIETTVFSKPTDDHLYLHPSSNHPKHVSKSIPFSIGIRLKRIVSEPNLLPKVFSEYKDYLISRGYNSTHIDKQFNLALSENRDDLIFNTRQKKRTRRSFPLVLEHNPKLPSINKILKENILILHSNDKMKTLFPSDSLFWAPKRSKNLKEILAPSRFYRKQTKFSDVDASSTKVDNCNLCQFLKVKPFISSFSTGQKYKINTSNTCNSQNVIYCINDLHCKKQNVGSTTNLKLRFSNYKSHIKKNIKGCNLYSHWNDTEYNHPSTHPVPASQKDFDILLKTELEIVILEVVKNIVASDPPEIVREKLEIREGFWQARLRTEMPYGLNSKDEIKNQYFI